MIHVRLRPEPPEFESCVREPGQRWLSANPAASGADASPTWRAGIPLLRSAYKGICAYLCCWVAPASGAGSVDHFVAKSTSREKIYEWDNYRFACSRMNGRKGVHEVTDPCEIADGWFALDLRGDPIVTLGPSVPPEHAALARDTIEITLRLNSDDCIRERREYLAFYRQRQVTFEFLMQRAPFLAIELCRQGLLHAEDQHRTASDVRAWLDAD